MTQERPASARAEISETVMMVLLAFDLRLILSLPRVSTIHLVERHFSDTMILRPLPVVK